MKCMQLRITGKVQGVWYRRWTVGQANALGLSGWVRNRKDKKLHKFLQMPSKSLSVSCEFPRA